MNIFHEFQHLIAALNAVGVPYAVCGGLAMAVHGYPRATKDIDLLIHPNDLPQIESVVKKAGFDVPGGTLTFKHGTPEETRVPCVLAKWRTRNTSRWTCCWSRRCSKACGRPVKGLR